MSISRIWSDEDKLTLWQETELAVIYAKEKLGLVPSGTYDKVSNYLRENTIDINWWLARDAEVRHDLNAFLDERLRFLPPELQSYFHAGMTSYDTEEPAFAKMLRASLGVFNLVVDDVRLVLISLARRYRYTIMNGRTHGQEAELQSFGKRCLTWLEAVRLGIDNVRNASENLKYSKLSGAIGNYRGIDPEVEKEALALLGLEPFYGATQIIPRELYAPIAQALCQIVLTLNKIALDIRLGARSGLPIYQEPFSKKQKGSSAMPHKKNTIFCEQVEGMARMAEGFCQMIMKNIVTWEERAIEQSSVERVAWPDLFHVVIHSVKTMTRVLEGLNVYPDHMMQEIIDSCGCYASSEAKEFLRRYGVTTEDAYRIVQLAAFNAFEPEDWAKALRKKPCSSLEDADREFSYKRERRWQISIQRIISESLLHISAQLEASEADVMRWNALLRNIFSHPVVLAWNQLFSPSYLLQNEKILYREILGED